MPNLTQTAMRAENNAGNAPAGWLAPANASILARVFLVIPPYSPRPTHSMKSKFLSVLLVILSCVALIGCAFPENKSNVTISGSALVQLSNNSNMYSGEQMFQVAGYPALVKFVKGDPSKPTVVLIPGNNSLARIFYGYPGGNPKDFLEYWLHKAGYSVLAISYPMDNSVYPDPTSYAQLTLADYATQVSVVTKYFMAQNNLSNNFILTMWSGGGRPVVDISSAFKQSDLNLNYGISLAATPPMMGVAGLNQPVISPNFPVDKNGYLANVMLPNLEKQLNVENKLNNATIIPKNIYETQFVGASPIQFYNPSIKWNGKKIVVDTEGLQNHMYYSNFSDYPIVAAFSGNNQIDALHELLGVPSWNLISQESVYLNHLNLSISGLSSSQWRLLSNTIKTIPTQLTYTMTGSHFFFIGENGAKQTVANITKVGGSINKIRSVVSNKEFAAPNSWLIK